MTLRLTRSDISSSAPVMMLTKTIEPSWLFEVQDLQAQQAAWNSSLPAPQARPVGSFTDRLWVFWRRSAGVVGGGPALYYKTLRPAIQVRRRRFVNPNITVRSRPDLVAGVNASPAAIPFQDIDMSEGMIYFREEDEGTVIGGRPVPVEVTYTDPLTGSQVTELQRITWHEETGDTAVPLDVSVNEGSLTAFPVYERTQMLNQPGSSGQLVPVQHLQKMWLFWSITRGTGNDLFKATIAPRFQSDPLLVDARFGIRSASVRR
jgi:hypothetical protein